MNWEKVEQIINHYVSDSFSLTWISDKVPNCQEILVGQTGVIRPRRVARTPRSI